MCGTALQPMIVHVQFLIIIGRLDLKWPGTLPDVLSALSAFTGSFQQVRTYYDVLADRISAVALVGAAHIQRVAVSRYCSQSQCNEPTLIRRPQQSSQCGGLTHNLSVMRMECSSLMDHGAHAWNK